MRILIRFNGSDNEGHWLVLPLQQAKRISPQLSHSTVAPGLVRASAWLWVHSVWWWTQWDASTTVAAVRCSKKCSSSLVGGRKGICLLPPPSSMPEISWWSTYIVYTTPYSDYLFLHYILFWPPFSLCSQLSKGTFHSLLLGRRIFCHFSPLQL